MEELDRELFGSDSDSDSDSDQEIATLHEPQERCHWIEDPGYILPDTVYPGDQSLSMETDPIYQSIMESGDNCPDEPVSVASEDVLRPHHDQHPHIPGLCLHSHVISQADQAKLMAQITEKNIFKAGKQNQAMCFGERDLAWLLWLEKRMWDSDVLSEPYCGATWTGRAPLFDQSIMNLYYPGDGIKPHVDLARFEDGIVIISLLSAINMDFYPAIHPVLAEDPLEGANTTLSSGHSQEIDRRPSFTIRLEPGSVITMQGPARYEWEHGIQEIAQDLVGDEWVRRKIRVSITLRKMRMDAWDVGPKVFDNGVADRR